MYCKHYIYVMDLHIHTFWYTLGGPENQTPRNIKRQSYTAYPFHKFSWKTKLIPQENHEAIPQKYRLYILRIHLSSWGALP